MGEDVVFTLRSTGWYCWRYGFIGKADKRLGIKRRGESLFFVMND